MCTKEWPIQGQGLVVMAEVELPQMERFPLGWLLVVCGSFSLEEVVVGLAKD